MQAALVTSKTLPVGLSLTSALRSGVSPVVLLTVRACLPSKAVTTLALSRELKIAQKIQKMNE